LVVEVGCGELGGGHGTWTAEIASAAIIAEDADADHVIADLSLGGM
jgi:hypothetical protein